MSGSAFLPFLLWKKVLALGCGQLTQQDESIITSFIADIAAKYGAPV